MQLFEVALTFPGWIKHPDCLCPGKGALPDKSADTIPTIVELFPVPGGPWIRQKLFLHDPLTTFDMDESWYGL